MTGASGGADMHLPAPDLEFLARFEVGLARPPWELGATGGPGRRRIIPITGGRFAGPRLNGEILDQGADWQVVRADGVAVIDTRYLLRLDGGELAYLRTAGFRHGPPAVLAALADGQPVDPADYYFRVTLTFETASATHAWLTRTVAVGIAARRPDAVVYDAYALR